MKKLFLSLLLAAALPFAVLAQAPQALNYQAVARNAAGAVLANQTINVKLSINNNTAGGTTVYSETHTGVSTNQFGLFTVEVGNGAASTGTFPAIDWANGAKFLKVEVDFGTGTYTNMGTSQLLSVPYSLMAGSVANDNDEQSLSISGSDLTISNGNTVTLPTGAEAINDLNDVNTTGAVNGQILQWNGTNWAPATVTGGVGDNWGTQSVVTNSPLTGTGVPGNALKLQDGSANGQVLRWNGSAWVATAIPDNDAQTLSLSGSNLTISNGNSVTLPTSTDAQTLTLSGSNLSISNGNSVTLPTGTTYTAGSGVSISGSNVISATDNSASNEIQTLTLSGTNLSLSNGGGSVTLPSGGGSYTGGTGISVTGTTINNTGDLSSTNEIQTLTLSGTSLSLSNGGGSVTLPSGGGGLTLPYAATVNSPSILFDIEQTGSGTSGNAGYFTNSNTTNSTDGVAGQTYGVGSGVFGYNNNGNIANTVWGVYGAYNGGSYGAGVTGIGWGGIVNPTLEDIGVYGSSNNVGVYGQSNFLNGVLGKTTATDGVGVYGLYEGTSDFNTGVYGYNDYDGGTQVIGVQGMYNTTSYGVGVLGLGYNGGAPPTSTDYGVYGSATYGVYGYAPVGGYAVYSEGDFAVTGLKSASVPTSQGNQLVYCMESPEVWFEDFGHGMLNNGEVTITLDPMFLETVVIDEAHPMIVTVTPQGDCKGLYVVPGTTSFTVKELGGGNANVSFSYRLTCKRTNYQDHRFGSDVTQGSGDTRTKYHYMTPKPVDYNAAMENAPQAKKSTTNTRAQKRTSNISGKKIGSDTTQNNRSEKPNAASFRK